jgi:hypothetical protein
MSKVYEFYNYSEFEDKFFNVYLDQLLSQQESSVFEILELIKEVEGE